MCNEFNYHFPFLGQIAIGPDIIVIIVAYFVGLSLDVYICSVAVAADLPSASTESIVYQAQLSVV